jgi:hypothetical protein
MLVPRAGFEATACRVTAEMIQDLNALSGVANEKSGAIFASFVALQLRPRWSIEVKAYIIPFHLTGTPMIRSSPKVLSRAILAVAVFDFGQAA